jgi:hypothetical protein
LTFITISAIILKQAYCPENLFKESHKMGPGVIIILAAVFAVAATVLAFVFLIPEKRASKFKGFLKFLNEALTFKNLVFEKFIHALYVLSVIFSLTYGFFMLFSVREVYHYGGYYGNSYYTTEWTGYYGLIIMVLGPIAVRISYELLIMLVLLVKNVIEINKKLKSQNEPEQEPKVEEQPQVAQQYIAQPVAQPVQQPVQQPVAPQPTAQYAMFCAKCGSKTNPDGTCPYCH